jgi:pimeloyl-ACP methyl ester carboxylesterase
VTARLETLTTGSGDPVTLFLHGMASSIRDTRPFGSGVTGRRVFLHLRGHGRSPAPPADDVTEWTYRALADDVLRVADDEQATQALGVSFGAAVLLAALAQEPGRFDRLVLALPATIDRPRPPEAVAAGHRLADALDSGDQVEVTRLLVELQPPAVRPRMDVRTWARRHADWLAGSAVSRPLRALSGAAPLADAQALARVEVPVLVLAQTDDPVHPVSVAEELASRLPNARLEVSDVPWLWGARDRARQVVGGFLSPAPPSVA